MGKFDEYGVIHFGIDCDIFVGSKKRYPTKEEFLKDAMGEDAGYELGNKTGWDESKVFNYLLPWIGDDGYVVHRIGYCPSEPDLDDWWEFLKQPGRGHVPAWYLDMESVDEPTTRREREQLEYQSYLRSNNHIK